ncbi:hypothetical protein Z043_121366 [Scleropages formosus]|uniref:Uncharacterized protein n=1 Tax=Scleropages formosus TaxID=113540 RepID=A0A0P7U1N4_SCLFO|nr:hypothetical protein Z043_121366 [Scleropages formosus]
MEWPLDDALEDEEEECVSEENELPAKEEFSVEENFSADFEPENLSCEDMEYFCSKGEEEGTRDVGDLDVDGQTEKPRHPPLEPEDWDGPSKAPCYVKTSEAEKFVCNSWLVFSLRRGVRGPRKVSEEKVRDSTM